MEDLFDVQVHKMDTLLEGQKLVQTDDLISKAIFETSSTVGQIMQAFQNQRFSKTPVTVEKLRPLLMRVTEWATVLFYCFDMDPPDIEEMPEAAENFEPVIAVDPILASLYIQRCLADVSLEYFAHDDGIDYDEIETYLIDILACTELIARRVNTNLSNLIIGI
jgi:hypothetical protein